MKTLIFGSVLAGALSVSACASSPAAQTDLTAAYNVAAAVEAAYVASPDADPAVIKQADSLLASAQAALFAWESAPNGSTAESAVLSAAIAALVAFEAQIPQPSTSVHTTRDCNLSKPVCGDGVRRG
jgi:hypothetical protein